MPSGRSLLTFVALALSVAPALAAEGDGSAGVDFTAGSNAYRAARVRASFDLRDSFYLAPRASFYRSNDVNGTYKLFGLRGGYEPGAWSFGGDVAVLPRVDGYERTSLGADAAYAFRLSEEDKNTALDLGGGVTLTRHSDLVAGAPGSNGRGRGGEVSRSAEFVVRESDLFVFGTLRGRAAALTGRLSKSSYDRDLAAANARRPLSAGGGFDAAVVGFPDTVVSAALKVKAIPDLEPFVSVARTTFELGDPPATSYEAGATAWSGRLGLAASLELYRQRGFADRRYLTLGASLEF